MPPYYLAVGDRISCMFYLPDIRKITAVGEVVRTTRLSRITKQYGIKFVYLYPEVKTEIENYVALNAAA